MKRIFVILCLMGLVLGLTACAGQTDRTTAESSSGGNAKETATVAPYEVVKTFFAAFNTADYETMKQSCTTECFDSYFHEGDVFGMVRANATKIAEEPKKLNETEYSIFVDVEMETAKTSALYNETETSFSVVLQKGADNSWHIDRFITG